MGYSKTNLEKLKLLLNLTTYTTMNLNDQDIQVKNKTIKVLEENMAKL